MTLIVKIAEVGSKGLNVDVVKICLMVFLYADVDQQSNLEESYRGHRGGFC